MTPPTHGQDTSDNRLHNIETNEHHSADQSEFTSYSAALSSFHFAEYTTSNSVPTSFEMNSPHSFDYESFEPFCCNNTMQQEPSSFGSWMDGNDTLSPMANEFTQWQAFSTADAELSPNFASGYALPEPAPLLNGTEIDAPAAAQLASRLLYVDKATSIDSKDLPKRPKTRSIGRPKRRIDHQPRTPVRRRDQPRHVCGEQHCTVSFARPSDLQRHLLAVHGHSDLYYQCLGLNCTYQTRRKDKMQEHCRKMHRHLKGSEAFNAVRDEGSQIGVES